MRTLKKHYLEGLILYPRVENGYIKESLFSYFPHPELHIINPYFEPLKKSSYALSDESLLLHFHNLRYFNISSCENIQNILKGRIEGKKKNLSSKDKQLIDNYRFFLNKKNEVDFDYFLKNQLNHYKKNKPTLLKIDYNKDNFLDEILTLHESINTSCLPNNELQNITLNEKEIETKNIIYTKGLSL